ncbi:MAG: NusG domain II-containing protein [Clostridiales bacterium]|nr:NusG domain II-containing protein [Clostridiales bacterium]
MRNKDGQSNISAKKRHYPERRFKFASGDVLILLAVVIASAIMLVGVLFYEQSVKSKTRYVQISMDGQVLFKRDLSEFEEPMEYQLTVPEGMMVIYISSEEVYVKESPCEDKICVKEGALTHVGDGAVCLPNRVVVQIVAGEGESQKGPQDVDAVAR